MVEYEHKDVKSEVNGDEVKSEKRKIPEEEASIESSSNKKSKKETTKKSIQEPEKNFRFLKNDT